MKRKCEKYQSILLLPWSLLDLIIFTCMQRDFIWMTRGHPRMTFAPVIRDGKREYRSCAVERGTNDWTRNWLESFQSSFGIFIPEGTRPVPARRSESPMLLVEDDGVDSINQGGIFLHWSSIFSMASKGEIERAVLFFHILNGHASFDRPDSKAICSREAGDNSSLPFKRRWYRFINCSGVSQVDNDDVLLGSTDHQKGVNGIHGIAPLGKRNAGHGRRTFQIPILDRLIPASGGQNTPGRGIDPTHARNRSVVCTHLGVLASLHVKGSSCVVGSDGEQLASILVPAQVEDGAFVRVHRFGVRLARVGHFVQSDFIIPAGHREYVGRWTEYDT